MIYAETAALEKNGQPLSGPTFRCAVVPVTPDNVIRQAPQTGMSSKVTYRLFCRPLPPPHQIQPNDMIAWRNHRLSVIGLPMLNTIGGRVHHLEVYLGVETPSGT